jgi:hypothetical protein
MLQAQPSKHDGDYRVKCTTCGWTKYIDSINTATVLAHDHERYKRFIQHIVIIQSKPLDGW